MPKLFNESTDTSSTAIETVQVGAKPVELWTIGINPTETIFEVTGLPLLSWLIVPSNPSDGAECQVRCKNREVLLAPWVRDFQSTMEAILQAHPELRYSNESYARTEGKTPEDIEAALRQVFLNYPEYSDPSHGLGDFNAMVCKFAADDFYHFHYLAIAHLSDGVRRRPNGPSGR